MAVCSSWSQRRYWRARCVGVGDGKPLAKDEVQWWHEEKLGIRISFAATATEALEFEKRRIVILDTNGDVMAVDGDGPTEAPMMAI